MAFWLFKSEPGTWSWEDQVAAGAGGTQWDGVRNYQARNNMDAMQVGELGFFYHSVAAKEIVGIVKVIAPAHPDSTTQDDRWRCVDLAAVEALPRPVTLDEIKHTAGLEQMVLVNNSRLSVQPVSDQVWRAICSLGGKTD